MIAELLHAQRSRAPQVRKLGFYDEPRENAQLLHELVHLRCSGVHLIEVSKGGGRGWGDTAIYGLYRYVPL